LFSATYKDEVRLFAERVVPNANMISLKREELSVDAIKQMYLDCPNADSKYEILCSIYGLCNIGQSIIFCHVCNYMLDDNHLFVDREETRLIKLQLACSKMDINVR
jgi:superfamily II DNA/RNA helicase